MPIDYSEYPPNWKEIRARILERAKHRCEGCGVPNYEVVYRDETGWKKWPEGMAGESLTEDGIKATRIILTIAHLDHDKHNHEVSDDRLKALCQRCHLNYDRPRHVAKRKAKVDKLKGLNMFEEGA